MEKRLMHLTNDILQLVASLKGFRSLQLGKNLLPRTWRQQADIVVTYKGTLSRSCIIAAKIRSGVATP